MRPRLRPGLRWVPALVGACLGFAPGSAAAASDTEEITELRRAVEALQAENRALARRLETLEGGRAPTPAPGTASPPVPAAAEWGRRLEQRVQDLETGKSAQEDAVRSILRDSMAKHGSKINEAVSFGGTLAVTASRNGEFGGERRGSIGLSGLDLELEIQASEWVLGQIKLESLDRQGGLLRTSGGTTVGVDRLAVDTALITLGDLQRFPLSLTAGRMVLPFGISTGRPVADVLSVDSPLTVEVFEMRANALALNTAFPTPALAPPAAPVVAPPVRPRALYPLLAGLGEALGYQPPPSRPAPLAPVSFAPPQPPFNAGVLVYEGQTGGGISRHWGATAGLHLHGHCGKPYDELAGSGLCPWAVNVDLNYNSSAFDSRFLATAYEGSLSRIGQVPALAASLKAAAGAYALVLEWNGATRHARFADQNRQPVDMRPTAWQVALGWQLDWNPWVQEIGAQGSYLAIGYSESRDLAGLVPRRRLLLTAGEWVVEGLRVVLEWSRDWDYPLSDGQTGGTANGLAATLTYVW